MVNITTEITAFGGGIGTQMKDILTEHKYKKLRSTSSPQEESQELLTIFLSIHSLRTTKVYFRKVYLLCDALQRVDDVISTNEKFR